LYQKLSDHQAAALAQRQGTLEQGMDRLVTVSETLSTTFGHHSSMIKQANNITNELLDALEATAAVASSMNKSFSTTVTTRSFWPLVVFPTAFLVVGSYGLSPSVVRNIGLLGLGEAAGLVFSSYWGLTVHQFDFEEQVVMNTTASSL
jgi:hypothetical protein